MTQATTWGVPLAAPSSKTNFATRADDSLDALLSAHKGSSAPSYAVAGTIWCDDAADPLWTVKVFDGSDWTALFTLDTTNNRVVWHHAASVDAASASTVDLGAVTSSLVRITGTTTITAFGTAAAGTQRILRFAGVLTLTHNATSLILPGGASVVTAANDVAICVSEGSGNWRVVAFIPAAPPRGAGIDNIVVNGAHPVSQENGDSAVTASGSYPSDQWYTSFAGTMAVSAQRVTDAPPGYAHSVKLTITTDDAALGATDFIVFGQNIERRRVKHLELGTANARSSRVGLWVKCSQTGTFAVAIRSAGNDRTWLGTITINATDTWEFKSFAVPAETGGTWGASDTVLDATLMIGLGAGSTYAGSAGWNASNYLGLTGQTNLAATLNATFQFTGVHWLGGDRSPAEVDAWLYQRDADAEEYLCRRYYQAVDVGGLFLAGGAGETTEDQMSWSPVMRTTPSTSGPSGGTEFNVASHTVGGATAKGFRAALEATGSGYCYGIDRTVIGNARM